MDNKNEVKHALWINIPNRKYRICSNCGKDEPHTDDGNIVGEYYVCPYCNANMDADPRIAHMGI